MLTDKQIEALYAQIRWRIDAVNDEYLQTVGEQINAIGKLNPSSIRKLAQMRKYGANSARIKKKLQEALNMSADEVQDILDQAAKEEYKNYDFLGVQRGRSPIPIQYNYGLQTFIKAVAAQTAETFQNYSNTTSIDEEYKEVVSQAVDAVARGVTDYNQAIRASMRKLGGDGLRVTYESGLHRRMDTAIRMNILDSVRQVSMQAAKMAGEEIGADGVELSAHPFSALDHEDIQGRMYTMENYQKMQTEQPFEDVDGHQYKPIRRPITQWNCRHFASPVLLGISQRRYTDEQLAQWKRNNHAGCEIGGEHYTIYQASQLMRKIETEVRKQKDIANTAKAYGDDVLRREAQANIVKLKAKYSVVAEQANLKARPEKMVVESYKSGNNRTDPELNNHDGNDRISTGAGRIEARNPSVGNPSAISHFGVKLSKRQKNLLEQLPGYDSSVIVPKKAASMRDLAALTAETGVEYSMFTLRGNRLIIRGDSRSVNVDVEKAAALSRAGYRWSGHTHPGLSDNVLVASYGDMMILQQFNQKTSVAYNSAGHHLIFRRE